MARPLRVGLIGAGNISRAHIPAYRAFPEQIALVAVCDIDEAAARTRAEGTNATIYTDAETMLRKADLDAVDICTIHDQHAPLALAAIARGLHVLVEKPMACSMDECRAMVTAANDARITLMVGQQQRYDPSYRGVLTLIHSGELGTIRAARLDAMQNLEAYAPPGHWLYDGRRAGGGAVISLAVHKLDLLRYLMGEVRHVSALARTTSPHFINGAEDYTVATLEFESGAIGELFATYAGFRMPWSESFALFGDTGTIHAVPPQGTDKGPALVASMRRSPALTRYADQFGGFVPVESVHTGLPTEHPITNELLHFAECCRTGAEPLSSGRDNLGTMRVVFGIYESAKTGRPVALTAL